MSNRFAPLFAAIACVLGLAVTGTASAQVIYAESTTAPVTTTYAPVNQQYVAEDVMRLRLGGDLGIGGALLSQGGFTDGLGLLSATGRIGLQLNDTLGVYYQTGLWAVGRDTGREFSAVGIWTNTANIDFTFSDVFRVGFGGGIDVFGANYVIFPAIDAHAALLIGTAGPGPRAGFVIGVRAHASIDVASANVGVLFMPQLFAGFELY